MSGYQKLAEGAVSLIQDYIEDHIADALDTVGSSVGKPQVSLENPKSYFIFTEPQAYECPAVFIICDEIDFKIQDRKANFINADDKINVAIAVEDQDADLLTYKTWRYQSALHSILDGATITSDDSELVLKCVVYRARFSETYQRQDDRGPIGKFRKEVMLECVVTHFENF